MWVQVSQVSTQLENIVYMPGQTPGLVHNLGGPLVLTDRQNRRHSIWIYYCANRTVALILVLATGMKES